MAFSVGNNLNLAKGELQNAVIQNLASAPSSPVGGQIYTDTSGGAGAYVFKFHNGSAFVSLGAGSGTVTSVDLAVPSWLALSGNPITTSGTITISAATGQTANRFLATPNGSSGAVSLRAIVAADLPSLDGITAPAGDVSLNSHKITNLATPVSSTDAATKAYVDAAIQGVQVKPSANYATTGALPACTYSNGTSGFGATLTGNSNGALSTQDGQSPTANDTVLVKDQSTQAQNGLYTLTQVGDGSHPFILTRHVDMDTSAEFGGALIAVEAGTTNGGSLWLCTVNSPTVGTTAVTFTELNKAADLQQGTGITISGNTISVATSYAGGTSITTVGTVGTGTWQGTAVGISYGGTGATSATAGRQNLNATGVYTAAGSGTGATFTISQATHGLGTSGNSYLDLMAVVYDKSANPAVQVYPDVSVNTSTGAVTFTWAVSQTLSNFQFTIIGK